MTSTVLSFEDARALLDARQAAYASLSKMFRREIDGEHAAAYAHLFLMGRASVHPYESAYTSDKGLLMQEACRDARRCYATAGFSVSSASDELADHVALELEFMAHLAARLSRAVAAGDADAAHAVLASQQAFHRVHLHWIPRFAHDVEQRSRVAFYRDAARTLASVVASDAVFMADLEAYVEAELPSHAAAIA